MKPESDAADTGHALCGTSSTQTMISNIVILCLSETEIYKLVLILLLR